MYTTRIIEDRDVQGWATKWPGAGFPRCHLRYTVDAETGDLIDYRWLRGDGTPMLLGDPEAVDGYALSALIDDAVDGKVPTCPGST
jgi:hypothetical protein